MVVRFCPKIISSVRAEDDASGTSFNLTRVMVFPGADLERKRLVKVNAAWALVPDDKSLQDDLIPGFRSGILWLSRPTLAT